MKKQNSPLRISSPISCPNIGMSICPGKIDPWAFSGPCERDLVEDLQSIKNWGAQRIITLLENDEIQYLQVSNLGTEAARLGMRWSHWEIVDGSALRIRNTGNTDIWRKDCELFLQELEAGKKIFIHCRGGLGRTGTLAARLLIERGLEPETAICEVREARPGAIETIEQEDYLRQKAWLSMS